jgi:hypothetical protein
MFDKFLGNQCEVEVENPNVPKILEDKLEVDMNKSMETQEFENENEGNFFLKIIELYKKAQELTEKPLSEEEELRNSFNESNI